MAEKMKKTKHTKNRKKAKDKFREEGALFLFFCRDHRAAIAGAALFFAVFALLCFLQDVPLAVAGYTGELTAFSLGIAGIFSYARYRRKHRMLELLKEDPKGKAEVLPKASGLLERDYQKMMFAYEREIEEQQQRMDRKYRDMVEYYTVWTHQIKTPIAAMRLLLQEEEVPFFPEMQGELFQVEQYVQMALQYLRMEKMTTDLSFRKQDLDEMIRQAVRKYASVFIRKKIALSYEPVSIEVLTDEKWLVFVLEQILSNALKYTKSGRISIYLSDRKEKILVIEDTGIGIAKEDLPRIFERGYTGYHGRKDKRSTGIGLYLCRQIMEKLSHTITIESEIGQGTRVLLGFSAQECDNRE